MTIERTRQIFGDKFKNSSDEEVLKFISQMSVIGDELLSYALSQLTHKDSTVKNKEHL